MALRGDSYGTVAEVVAFTRHLLDGQATFDAQSRPTDTDVEKFIDRRSGVLNIAFRDAGFAPSAIAANSTASLFAADWVVRGAVIDAELTQRGTGYSGQEGSRVGDFRTMMADAKEYVAMIAEGLTNEGVARAVGLYRGLTFTALSEHDQRSDPDNTTREQPLFRRRQFDNPGGGAVDEDDD